MTSTTLDRSVLDHLRAALGDDTGVFAGRLIATYLRRADELVRDLQLATEQEDLPGMIFAAHSLKGSSATVGGIRLAELCQELEHWTGSPLEAEALVEAIRQEAAALSRDLATYPSGGT
jgi:HPt (histidine-containing phosphotransfer) domain-containing protein